MGTEIAAKTNKIRGLKRGEGAPKVLRIQIPLKLVKDLGIRCVRLSYCATPIYMCLQADGFIKF